MATIGITISKIKIGNVTNAKLPVLDSSATHAEAITSSASSQTSTNSVPSDNAGEYVWRITASGGAVWVTFAASPTAVAGTSWLIPDGSTQDFGATAGDKVAVINA